MRDGVLGGFFGKVFVPRLGIGEVVQDFTGACSVVSVVGEVGGDEFGIGHDFPHFLAIAVEAGAVRRDAGHDGTAGRIAGRGGAMSVGEELSAGGEAIEIGRDALFVSPHAADPVIEVVHGDEEDVGSGGERENKGGEDQEGGFHGGAVRVAFR